MTLGLGRVILIPLRSGSLLLDTGPLTEEGLLGLLTALSYLTSCFVVQKLHKQTVGHACWLVGVFLTDVYLQLYPEMRAPCGDTPAVRSRGAPSPWAAPERCGATLAGCQQHRKQRAWLMYMSPCGLWSQPHPTFPPAQAARATGNGRGYI